MFVSMSRGPAVLPAGPLAFFIMVLQKMMNLSAQALRKALDYRHAQARSLNLGNPAVLGPGIILADVLDKFRTHY